MAKILEDESKIIYIMNLYFYSFIFINKANSSTTQQTNAHTRRSKRIDLTLLQQIDFIHRLSVLIEVLFAYCRGTCIFQLETKKDSSATRPLALEKWPHLSPFANFEQPGRSFTMRWIPLDQGIGITIYGHRIGEDSKHNHKNT